MVAERTAIERDDVEPRGDLALDARALNGIPASAPWRADEGSPALVHVDERRGMACAAKSVLGAGGDRREVRGRYAAADDLVAEEEAGYHARGEVGRSGGDDVAVPAARYVWPADVLDFSEDTPGSAVSSAAPRRPPAPPSRAPPSKELPRPDGAISPAPRVGCASPCRATTLRSLPLPYMTDVLEPLGVPSATCPHQVRPRRGGAPGPSSTHFGGRPSGAPPSSRQL